MATSEEYIDKILQEVKNSGILSVPLNTSKERYRIIQKAYNLGLLEKTPKGYYKFSKHGQEVIDYYGSYKNYLHATIADKEKNEQIKDLTLKQLKGNIFHLEYWWLFLIINAIIAFLISYLIEILIK